MVENSYIIIDDNSESILATKSLALRVGGLHFVGSADNFDDGLDLILEQKPSLIFLEIDPKAAQSNLSLQLVTELHRYLKVIPKIIITTKGREMAFDALKHEIFDYLIKPLQLSEFRKSVLRFQKSLPAAAVNFETSKPVEKAVEAEQQGMLSNVEIVPAAEILSESFDGDVIEVSEKDDAVVPSSDEKPLIICVKSYGDYRFINASDICYLQADNNSTDIHLNNGEMITAFKTLKHFESVLSSPFVRIHNSYIVNIDYVSRIHTGNAVCYIKNTAIKLPFSKSYKENVDAILNSIIKGNYLEI